MDLAEAIAAKKEELQIHQFGFMTTEQLSIQQGVRDLCEMNSCGRYGNSWSCPPAVGTLEECRAKIMQYKNVFVYTTKHDLEDSYDFEGMMAGKDAHEKISAGVVAYFKTLVPGDKLILSGDGCGRCAKCAYPDAPCRFPGEVYPTVESYGVEVYRMAQTLHINYINGKDTVTYFSCIMY
ncbi:MAG: DUF2284 domain-containing protein [Lachnospiraceae bacterium]|nr:DUF2284 domain-containing protein [Lachnospiraceae bacterium]